ncbi:dermonecrotic toxin domain-containing protein [Luteibacter sp. NPDC031894]|uniref:dermonecrotic toxin domain-containing protein n=1 Tax=Luteibacter sp. NPDC031894 TaxID=3390572 RepID=UPI003CFC9EA9
MTNPFVPTRLRTIGAVLATASTVTSAQVVLTDAQRYETVADSHYEVAGATGTHVPAYATDEHASAAPTAAPSAWIVALEFATADDAQAFDAIAAKANALPPPDAQSVARAFIKEHLGIESDDYVVAHFASANDREAGKPDSVTSLTEAVMEAFPDHSRYGTFAVLADAVGGVQGGGRESPSIVGLGESIVHASDTKSAFVALGKFLWSRTGPGYLYNTFFAKGNVIETVAEESRYLDDAFRIYRKGGFTADHASPFWLSRLVDEFKAPGAFSELPYVKKLDAELQTYWTRNISDWSILARYEFVLQARLARESGLLDPDQYELVMRGGAQNVPLDGPITMAQLRNTRWSGSVEVKRFDINGHTASNLVRFIATDGSEVMYVPGGEPAFVAAGDEAALRQWVLAQAKDPRSLDALLSHFSVYNRQDGVFWTGVKHGLENIANDRWHADGSAIDHANATIGRDVFEDMREATKLRMQQDASMQRGTAWEAWRATINRVAALLSPLGFVRPLAIPVQVGLGIAQVGTGTEQAIDGRTLEERKSGLEQAGLTIVSNVVLGGVFGRTGNSGPTEKPVPSPERQPLLNPPRRINGRIGYPLSPTRAPGFPTDAVTRLYRDPAGHLAHWAAADAVVQTVVDIPSKTLRGADGIFKFGPRQFVRMEGGRVARIVSDGDGYRILLNNRTSGPRVVRQRSGNWALAFTDDNYVKGSILAQVAEAYTSHPETLHRAAEILDQFGSSEADLVEAEAKEAGPLATLATGHAFLETLADRLRDPRAIVWTPREIELLAPSMARDLQRALALHGEDGAFRFGVSADGAECDEGQLLSNTIHLQLVRGQYVLRSQIAGAMANTWRSVFHIVGKEAGRVKPQFDWDGVFRRRLADSIDGRSTNMELDLIHKRWIDPMAIPDAQRAVLKELSWLRQAVFGRDLGPTLEHVAKLRRADDAWRLGMLPGEADALPAFDDVMAKIDGPDKRLAPAEAAYLGELLSRVSDEHDALLPRGLDHLVVKDPAVVAYAASQALDEWTWGNRHYIRLRHLDGRTQVVETEPSYAGDYRQILGPGAGAGRGTGRYVVDIGGTWFPEAGLRDGFALMPPLKDTEAFVTIDARPPPDVEEDLGVIEHMVNSIPQPILRLVGTSLPTAELTPNGSVDFSILDPRSGRRLTFPTRLDTAGQPVPRARPVAIIPDLPATPTTDQHLVMPAPEGSTSPLSAADKARYIGMLHAERPISAFIETGYADRHIKALVQTRRLRGMVREDTHMAVIGATTEHAFTMVLPVDAESVGFLASQGASGRLVGSLPAGTVIVDPMFGVRATAAEYPSRVRAVAAQWETQGIRMRRIERDGSETTESPVAFAERLLATPVRPNLWNPAGDAISEVRYARYMRRLFLTSGPVRRAGLDWLETRRARRDYMAYFAPPYDVMPNWDAPPSTDLPARTMYELAETAIGMGSAP